MSHKHPGSPNQDASDERRLPPRARQPPVTSPGEPPARRSWRPCQMQGQDGEPNPHHHHHHHHHPHQHRGPPKQRRRLPPGQGRGPGWSPAVTPPTPEESRETEPPPVHQPRPAVSRYRRPGDPRPRPRQPLREVLDSSPTQEQLPPEDQLQERACAPQHLDRAYPRHRLDRGPPHQLQERAPPPRQQVEQGSPTRPQDRVSPPQLQDKVFPPRQLVDRSSSPHQLDPGSPVKHLDQEPPSPPQDTTAPPQQQQTSVAIFAPTHFLQDTPPDADALPPDAEASDKPETEVAGEEADSDGNMGQPEPDAERPSEATRDETAQGGLQEAGGAEEDEQGGGAPEISDLCSDTESAASLSLDGPLHSPPPLHSPSPPSSPDTTPFPPHDHFSEDAGSSPPPDDSQPLPEEDEEEEEEVPVELEEEEEDDCSDWCSLDAESQSESQYPKTYADFYSESYPKAATLDPPVQLQSKPPPCSFPEPLRTAYPSKPPQEPRPEPPANHPHQNVHQGAPPPFTKAPRPSQRPGGRSRGSPPDRSVGCRLHHYDGSSDGERDGGSERSPVTRGGTWRRGVEAREGNPTSGRSSPVEFHDNTISMAIKDIKEAIEEVKIRTVRSPYTPDSSVEPVWVMRQEVSPSEEACSAQHPAQHPAQHSACCSSPHSPAHSESPSSYVSAPPRQATVSPARQAESSRGLHPRQHRLHQPQLGPGYCLQEREAPGALQPTQQQHQQQQQQRERSRLQHQQPPLQHAPHPPPQQQQQQQQQQLPPPSVQDIRRSFPQFPTFVDVPGPCDPEDLIDGIIFAATYLGCTHLLSERTPTKSARMQQAQEAWNRVRAAQKQAKNRKKSPEGDDPSTAEVDLFMSTQRIKVLNADTQESLMDLPLRTISYIADIGNMVVLMARGKMVRSRSAQDHLEQTAEQSSIAHDDRRLYRMICHVFESEDAKLIAQSIGQSFSVAYQEFLRANGIDPDDLSQREYSDLLNTQDMYNDDLIHFSKSENCRDVYIEKQKGEMLGVVIVESGWGSILPTVIIASMMHAGPAEKSGRLNIGDQIMTVNGTSLVGLPLSTCQSIIKGLKSQSRIKMNIVRCPPVTMVLIRRPDLRYQLGFSVQNGIICSLMRGGIAERGGVRVGHRIIEINGQSVVATPHEKIVQILSNAMGEIHMKTMPAAMYRLLTAQEQPVYI